MWIFREIIIITCSLQERSHERFFHEVETQGRHTSVIKVNVYLVQELFVLSLTKSTHTTRVVKGLVRVE